MLICKQGRQIGLERVARHEPRPAKQILANETRKDKTLSAMLGPADKPDSASLGF